MTALLEACSISKSFGANRVLESVSLKVVPGEIVSLIGENGAGKSTLSKIFSGITPPDSGSLLLNGSSVQFSGPREAIDAGIGIVHQELCLAENLSIAENICLGREPTRFGTLDFSAMRSISTKALQRLGSSLSPSRLVSSLSAADRQLVEIARVLSYDAKLLIFDEPTSSLSESEAHSLLLLIKRLKADGVSVLYVSHRLPEVQEISDRVVALRDGRNSGEEPQGPFSRERLISMIVGREISDIYGYTPRAAGDVALFAEALRPSERHAPCSFQVRAGEIVGIAGLVGSGRTELLECLYGIREPLSGSLALFGAPASIESPADATQAGLALVPESRKEEGIVAELSIAENASLSLLASSEHGALRNFEAERSLAQATVESLKVRCSGISQPVGRLSGGNQQKVVIGRCLATKPRVLLLDEPTRGVDVGARREIYSLIFSLAEQGMAVLFVSSELEEVIGISDRVLVMGDGAIRGELPRALLSEHAIMSLASPQARIAA